MSPDRPKLLEELQRYVIHKKQQSKETSSAKPFLEYLWDKTPHITLADPFHQLVVDERILNVINSYLGMFANFYILMLNITIPIRQDAKAILSQRWHRDHEDKKLCKMFLYLNDVDEEAGPFTYIPHSSYGKTWGGLFKQQFPKGAYPKDGLVEQAIPPKSIKKIISAAQQLSSTHLL